MEPNEQNQHFAELRQNVCFYIHAVVPLRGLPNLDGKNELFVGKKRLAPPSQRDYGPTSLATSTEQNLNSCTESTGNPGKIHNHPTDWVSNIPGYGCDCRPLTSHLKVALMLTFVGHQSGT